MESQIDLLELLRHMFFVSNLHKKLGQVELIDTDTFKGPGFDFSGQLETCPVTFAGDGGSQTAFLIRSSQDASTKLSMRFPILNGMSFKNYRLVGGACTTFLRSTGYTEDIDFFPLVERYENESDTIREGRVQQIYVNFLREVEQIYKKSLEHRYNFIVYRNEDCTTILMTYKVEKNSDDKTKRRNMKIQFVHRAFESESQMLLCSDLMASQVLFDGMQFRCSYAAMLCLKSSIIPVDFSSASTSMAYRLHKYASRKGFLLAFCGLDPIRIKKVLKQKRSLEKTNKKAVARMTKHEKNIRTKEELKEIWLDSVIRLPCGLTIKKFSFDHHQVRRFSNVFSLGVDFHCKEGDGMGVAVADADYSDYSGVSNLEKGGELGEINMNAFIDGKQLHVYSNDVSCFLRSPATTTIGVPFMQLSHIKKDLSMDEIRRLFGGYARDAVIAYFDKDAVTYRGIVNKRIDELKEGMTPLFQALQRVKWRMVEPGAQAIGSMRPLKVTARQGYGELYHPFTCSYMWDVKMTIISALRRKAEEKKCKLVQYLGKDMIRLIFLHLDLSYAKEQMSLHFALCSEDVPKPKVTVVREMVTDQGNAQRDGEDKETWRDIWNEAEQNYWEHADCDFDSYGADDHSSDYL